MKITQAMIGREVGRKMNPAIKNSIFYVHVNLGYGKSKYYKVPVYPSSNMGRTAANEVAKYLGYPVFISSRNERPIDGYPVIRYEFMDDEQTKAADFFVFQTKREGVKYSTIRKANPMTKNNLPDYRKKSDEELRYIISDADEAARAMKGHSPEAELKYLDQINDASTVLYERAAKFRGRKTNPAAKKVWHIMYKSGKGKAAGNFQSKQAAEEYLNTKFLSPWLYRIVSKTVVKENPIGAAKDAFLYIVHVCDANKKPVYDIAKFRKLSEAKAYAKAYVTSANKPVCIETKKL